MTHVVVRVHDHGDCCGGAADGRVDAHRIGTACRLSRIGGSDEVALADTIGVGVPLRWHFHDTRNTGYANALVAADLGAAALDASSGGIGGCPFAPDATGNIATEDLVYGLHRSGYETDLDLAPLLPLERTLSELLGHEVPGQLARAGVFPPGAVGPSL